MSARDKIPQRIKELEVIRDAEESLKFQKQEWLRRNGWHYSSEYPDCCWRWSKTFSHHGKDVVVTETTDGAIALEWRTP